MRLIKKHPFITITLLYFIIAGGFDSLANVIGMNDHITYLVDGTMSTITYWLLCIFALIKKNIAHKTNASKWKILIYCLIMVSFAPWAIYNSYVILKYYIIT